MSKKATLLLATVLLVVVAIAAPVVFATTQAQNGSQPQTETNAETVATPASDQAASNIIDRAILPEDPEGSDLSDGITTDLAAPSGVERAVPPAGTTGFYISNGITREPASPVDYSAVGSYRIWAWSKLQYGPDQYNWTELDNWVQRQLDAGYETVAFALNVYDSRYVDHKIQACVAPGIGILPQFVVNGPDNEFGTADDSVIEAGQPSEFDCDDNGELDDPWYLPDYTDRHLIDNYKQFIAAMADHIRNSFYHDKVGWIATGVGQYGENKAADNRMIDEFPAFDAKFLFDEGHLDDNEWLNYATEIIGAYDDAFSPDYAVITQNAPFFHSPVNRRYLANWAASRGIGISVNQLVSDTMSDRKCDNPDEYCLGMYDQSWEYRNLVPTSFEAYGFLMPTANEFYLAIARALHYKADYVRMETFWYKGDDPYQDTPENRLIAKWAAKYMGKRFDVGDEEREPPSVWSRMREHRNPCFLPNYGTVSNCNDWPTDGNYEFYLEQQHLPEWGGVTFPVTDDDRITHTGWVKGDYGVTDKPWHWNDSPYEQPMRDADLFHLRPGHIYQDEVDPGMIARRSDQVSENTKFIFDVEDAYFKRSQPPAESTFEVVFTVTYLDYGDDEWLLVYDAVGGPYQPAELYAINDWDIGSGLAVSGELPTTGVLPDPKPYSVKKTNTGQWKVATFHVRDGNFNNLLLGYKADFYIESMSPGGVKDGDEYIHHVDVRKVTEDIATPTPTVTPTAEVSPTVTPTPTATPSPTPTITPTPSTGSIAGVVFVDHNGNSQPDEGEGLYGATLTLIGLQNMQTMSNYDGSYAFGGLQPGQYVLSEEHPSGIYGPAKPASSIAIPVPNGVFPWNFWHDPVPLLYLPMMQVTSD